MITYPEEKRNVLINRSEELLTIARRIPYHMLGPLAAQLPKIGGGFRPGRDIPLRLQMFVSKISRWNEDDWHLMAQLWLRWTQSHSHLHKALRSPLQQDLEQLVSEANQSSERLREIVGELVAVACHGDLDQESIREWYELGPLTVDSMANFLISLAPTKDEKAWVGRLRTIEQRFPELEFQLRQMADHVRSLENAAKTLGDLAQQGRVLRSEVDELGQALAVVRNVQDNARKAAQDIISRLEQLARRNDELGARIDLVQSRMEQVESSDRVASRILAEQEAVYQRIEDLANELEALQAITSRLETEFTKPEDSPTFSFAPRIVVTHDLECDLPVRELRDLSDILAHLGQNLSGLGLTRKHARGLAVEVLTAVLTGQITLFSGSMALCTAKRCATSLCGNRVAIWHIPVGLLDCGELADRLKESLESVRGQGHPLCVILEGINRSAFEAYGSVLRELVCQRVLGLAEHDLPLIVFGTVVEGPSALPCGRELLEMGPVFDTDLLGWTYRWGSDAQPGEISSEVWSTYACLPISYDWEEEVLPRDLAEAAGPLWRRMVSLAYHISVQIDQGEDLHPACRLAFGWVLPMAVSLRHHLSEETIMQYSEDERCARLLSRGGE